MRAISASIPTHPIVVRPGALPLGHSRNAKNRILVRIGRAYKAIWLVVQPESVALRWPSALIAPGC